ncbi:MAG: 5-formyltetrahydrofolate cyclo-ligase [Bacteroidetes bacterium GWF2_38_335]|nr:MAG: 5-formyltetrahydrofolate cyclo-ligase [Bacteroidetes bacterium GWF2_38_335]OFY80119.1 MAG: 5-formyltetrahydrofolate cyclo-ligase [Bacteroidetes bacterium RIFOXYA12_FULL_38_20]HBS88554.1 5-formyltetrahydrofolate cyclo-ligase [Bacteroidales bacterium]
MTVDEQKKELRKIIRELKSQIPLDEKMRRSELIFKSVEKTDSFEGAKTIMLYWSMDDEVQTHNVVEKWYLKKTIILPVVSGDKLILKKYSGEQNMKTGQSYGIMEPIGEEFTDLNSIDLIIVPGVAFDKSNNRMGRGKAYYDKLLTSTKAVKIGVCFDFQYFESIPCDKYDVKMDQIIIG